MVWPAPAFTTGSVLLPAAFTVIVTSEVEDKAESFAVSRKTYVPEVENVAVVFSALAFPNVTVPHPLNVDQVVVSVPFGRPSSLAVPDKFALAGSVFVWFVSAFTTGVVFAALTVIVTSDVDERAVSLAVSRKTYVPDVENVAVV